MIEVIKEAGAILKDLPEIAVWILLGILFYKITILGSIFGIIKLAINKLHDFSTRERVVKKTMTINDKIITADNTHMVLVDFLDNVIALNIRESTHKGSYLHRSDIDSIKDAFHEKRARDKK